MASILQHTTVARDGFHNAFTDLQHWQGMYWVSYRKGSGHATMDGEAVISVSIDRARFREAARIKFYGDNRDPKLFPISADRMACTIPCWEGAYRGDCLRTYISFSGDGFNWEEPRPILETGQWLWRIREHGGLYYGLVQKVETREDGYRQHNLILMTSNDLLEWTEIVLIGNDDVGLNESDIVFQPDGVAWIVARSTKAPGYSYFCHAQPPYTEWEWTPLEALIHAPVMLEHEGRLYVAGRSAPSLEGVAGFPSHCSLGLWEVTFGKVAPVLRIPATGDCSYPGLIKDPEGRICLSYYSQHAYHLGVVGDGAPLADWQSLPADVYFAELEL